MYSTVKTHSNRTAYPFLNRIFLKNKLSSTERCKQSPLVLKEKKKPRQKGHHNTKTFLAEGCLGTIKEVLLLQK